MKVLLKKDVDNLGYAGDIAKVADGYGRNYLLPQGLAVKATPAVLREARIWRERAAIRRAELQSEYEALSERIVATTITFEALAGDTGKLYGSVTTNDVADQLNSTLGLDIDRRKVVGEPLRQLGEHKVTVRLGKDFQPQVTVIINQEGAEAEALAEAAAQVAEEEALVEREEAPEAEEAPETDEEAPAEAADEAADTE